MIPTTQKKLVRSEKMKSTWKTFITLHSKTFYPGLLHNVLVAKSLHLSMILNCLPAILGLNKSGGWEVKLLQTVKICFCIPLHFPQGYFVDGPRGGGRGGGYVRFRIIRMMEGFWGFKFPNLGFFGKLNSIKQLQVGNLWCATYPGLV